MGLISFLKKRLLYFSLLAFVFIASSALALCSKTSSTGISEVKDRSEQSFAEVPVLSDKSSFPIISGQAVLAVDLDSGVTLYEKDPDKHLLPASTTKIITALIALSYYPLDQIITVGDMAIDGQKMYLRRGEKISVENLLYGLLVFSANDAADVLATNYLGGRRGFIFAMNQKAKELHMNDTYFTNPIGLDGTSHYSTARDLVRASLIAMENPVFSKIVRTKEKTVTSQDEKIKHRLTNINELLGNIDGVLGVKTGWTEEARENLITYIERDKRKIMIAVLGSQDRFGETKELIDWIFANYEWKEVKIP